MSGPVWTLAGEAEHEDEVKKSRFIARAAPVESVEQALAFVERARESDASHNCWAYRIGQEYRFSDDGEPGGTAGRPILGAIERADLDGVVVVVSRYFGGIKLGAGGLARAYSAAAGACLRAAPTRERIEQVLLEIRAGFELAAALHAQLDSHGARKLQEDYTPAGIALRVQLGADQREDFERALQDASRGSVQVEKIEPSR